MEIKEILKKVDHTLLKQDATWEQIKQICDEGIEYSTASVCIPPSFVKKAAEYVEGKIPVCTVIGFPNGYNTTDIKCAEAMDAVKNGASEIDMVINLGWVKEKNYDAIFSEINKVKDACDGRLLKVIVETALLTDEEKVLACQQAMKAKATFVKTSTGFSTGGATVHDVALMKQTVGEQCEVKASGGVKTYQDMQDMIDAGATRIGTSSGVSLMKQ